MLLRRYRKAAPLQRARHYLDFTLTIEGGEFDGCPLTMIGSLQPKMLPLFARTLKALGIPTDGEVEIETSDKPAGLVISPEFEQLTARAVVVHDEWQGETGAKVKRLLPTPA